MDNKELATETATDFIKWAKESASTTTEFLSTEIPITLQEYLTWVIIDNSISVGVWMLFVMIIMMMRRSSNKSFENRKENDSSFWETDGFESWQISRLITYVASLVAFVWFITRVVKNIKMIFMCIFSPRIVILEKITEIVN